MNSKNIVPLFSAAKANAGLNFITPLTKTLDSHWYVLGQEVTSFENEFANYVGVSHCVSVANGSDALELALKGLNVGSGDRVVAVANAGFYGSTAIHAVGAEPVYIDVNPKTLTLCPEALKSVLDSKPSAIIVTHLYGQLADIETIVSMASSAGVPVIEDCAQSHGARRGEKQAGSFGTIACFSFYPTKNLGALGDGGAIVTNDEVLASRVKQLRQYGWSQKYEVSIPGGRNSRLDEIQAAILRIKLPLLDTWNEQRRSIARRYNAAFAKLKMQLPCSTDEDFVAHLYVVRVENRTQFSAALKEKFITTDIHYPIADHHQPAYEVTQKFSLAETELACDTVISLPCFPGLSDEEVDRVIDAVTAYFSKEI
ncbi:dTDP-4-amino-4,6-dideoxygalactose transaminase [Pseudomonas congelans]|uniref:Aminotransferase, DegT/DnrJ/EryC1/StrS family protein n=1 Tax=Pseudomonas congelans TaxID=200452 RepID=A0A0P9MU68_9PSED|nr:DegT/DnrJ/EryC1/StrS family aminotransferase [Pseudomonas congelans]KPW87816.1 Aminotransferase, DegT/DnrJ/EryC1/StrS family protein [Pseudomonas congelans]PBP98181.1 erythromycin biosynthesis sensory transduction protein eryC1 [Pseudomonas congelans]SDP08218.1 dTDP-4-amino-4,6-dideoxygalactose transaminase [Pseudomonas congelans]